MTSGNAAGDECWGEGVCGGGGGGGGGAVCYCNFCTCSTSGKATFKLSETWGQYIDSHVTR